MLFEAFSFSLKQGKRLTIVDKENHRVESRIIKSVSSTNSSTGFVGFLIKLISP